MPIHLFNLVAGLREKNAKGYPVKKVRRSSRLALREVVPANREPCRTASFTSMEEFVVYHRRNERCRASQGFSEGD